MSEARGAHGLIASVQICPASCHMSHLWRYLRTAPIRSSIPVSMVPRATPGAALEAPAWQMTRVSLQPRGPSICILQTLHSIVACLAKNHLLHPSPPEHLLGDPVPSPAPQPPLIQ